ncbi:hypothetical protein ACH47C_26870 [Streptomyces rishiriensis]|uniref:hypothetical protein n=1 Tax=Streptomyces rishiriensis TaxID=68264 RepID=UPI0033F7CC12
MNPGFVNAAEMLRAPKAADLAPERVTGKRCVWCGGSNSVALGARLSVIGVALKQWYPRGCRPCVRREARRVHGIHITTCARCTHGDYCPDSKALYEFALPRQRVG